MALLSIPSNTEAIPALFSLSTVHGPASHPEAFIAQAPSLSRGLLSPLRLRCALSPAQGLACTFGCWGLQIIISVLAWFPAWLKDPGDQGYSFLPCPSPQHLELLVHIGCSGCAEWVNERRVPYVLTVYPIQLKTPFFTNKLKSEVPCPPATL